MVMEWWMFIFSLARIFHDRVFLGVSYTCSRNYSVYYGGEHTLACRTHIFLHVARSQSHSHIFMRVTYTHGSSVCKKVFAHVSFLSPSRHLPSHVSPILALPWRSLRDQSRLRLHWLRHPRDLAVLSRPESAGHAPLRTCIAKFGYLAKSDANTGFEPKEFHKITSVENDTMLINEPNHNFSDFSKTTNENTRQFGVPTVFESSVSQRSHGDFAPQVGSKDSMQSGNRC